MRPSLTGVAFEAPAGRGRQQRRRHLGHHDFPPADFVPGHVGQPAAGGQPSAGDDGDAAAERLGVRQDVRAEEDGLAGVAQPQDQGADVASAQRVEPRHRLVEEDDLRVVDQRLRDADALHHALGVLAQLHAPLGAQDPPGRAAVVTRRGPLGRRQVEQARKVVQQLLGRQVVVEVRVLGQKADAAAHAEVAHGPAENGRVAGGGKDQLHQQLEASWSCPRRWGRETRRPRRARPSASADRARDRDGVARSRPGSPSSARGCRLRGPYRIRRAARGRPAYLSAHGRRPSAFSFGLESSDFRLRAVSASARRRSPRRRTRA